jgi:hypothetical protein
MVGIVGVVEHGNPETRDGKGTLDGAPRRPLLVAPPGETLVGNETAAGGRRVRETEPAWLDVDVGARRGGDLAGPIDEQHGQSA